MTASMELLEQVAAALRRQGQSVTIEYPGYISIVADEDNYSAWSVGTANGPWGGELLAGDGPDLGSELACFELPAASVEWTDADQIATAILDAIRQTGLTEVRRDEV